MKKLRMIITSVIVLAIIGSAFTFEVKKGAFCILDNTGNPSSTNCTTYITLKKPTSDALATSYKYAPCGAWEFDPVTCTAANNGLCTASPIRFVTD